MLFPNISISFSDFLFFLPEIYLTVIILALLLFISFVVLPLNTHYVKEELYFFFYDIIFIIGCMLFFFFYLLNFMHIPGNFLFHMAVLVDYFSHSLTFLVLVLSIFVFYSSFEFWKQSIVFLFEYPTLLFFSILFLILLGSTFNFISLYIILEGISLISYVLIVLSNVSYNSVISSLKYFCVGSIASGCLLFGIVLLYVLFGSVNFLSLFWKIFFLSNSNFFSFTLYFSILLICFGFIVKLGAFPGHFWVADVYNGCSSSLLFFLLLVVKLVILLVFARVLFFLFFNLFSIWYFLLLFSGFGSIIFGALGALIQKKIKRFLAFTSINQVGYILLGFSGGTFQALYISLIYLFFYTVAMLIFFFIYLNTFLFSGRRLVSLFDFNGFFKSSNMFAVLFTISILSMAGIPPLAGFMAKFWLISLVFFCGHFFIGGFTLFISFVSAVYYLRILRCVWFQESIAAENCYFFFYNEQLVIFSLLFTLSSILICWFVVSLPFLPFVLKLSYHCMCPLVF